MKGWPEWQSMRGLESTFASRVTAAFWHNAFTNVSEGRIDTWDFQWLFACWKSGALCALPTRNLTQNIGYGLEATHTRGLAPDYVTCIPASAMRFPLVHPPCVERSILGDQLIDCVAFKPSLVVAVTLLLKRLVRRLLPRKARASFVDVR